LEPNAQELAAGSIPTAANPKFLFPAEFSCAQVTTVLRKKLDLQQTESLLLFAECNGKYRLVKHGSSIVDIYNKFASKEDGMLYMVYAKENVFG
jgi:hypothetical protein